MVEISDDNWSKIIDIYIYIYIYIRIDFRKKERKGRFWSEKAIFAVIK